MTLSMDLPVCQSKKKTNTSVVPKKTEATEIHCSELPSLTNYAITQERMNEEQLCSTQSVKNILLVSHLNDADRKFSENFTTYEFVNLMFHGRKFEKSKFDGF